MARPEIASGATKDLAEDGITAHRPGGAPAPVGGIKPLKPIREPGKGFSINLPV
ncbi:MAG: hypothetical protein H8E78_09240 [Proteobacteria bacterium]|nr:hypothetical protein [Pseudomonadota bacterium]